jgi:hypothetical protein
MTNSKATTLKLKTKTLLTFQSNKAPHGNDTLEGADTTTTTFPGTLFPLFARSIPKKD